MNRPRKEQGASADADRAAGLRPQPAKGPSSQSGIPSADLPDELLSQLSCLPEDAPPDFTCAICEQAVSNRFNWSPRHYERPPICQSCESVKGYAWHGRAQHRTKPTGGTFRDRREALRIDALADAIAQGASQQKWRAKHGHA